MANKGFVNDPLANINLLRDTLHDRYYCGFPIVKELVQNADDATAGLLRFVWTNGLLDAQHPLLRGPALAVINDGTFSEDDGNAIRRMGINYKAAEKGSVGKFGLGLKSIFHLCEAFFFVANEATDVDVNRCQADILNPWSGPENSGLHEEWDVFSDECQAAVVQHLQDLLPTDRWFILWIPLRRLCHCTEATDPCDPIVSEFFDDKVATDVLPGNLDTQLDVVVPFLKNVRNVEGWTHSVSGSPKQLFGVGLENGFQRRRFPDLTQPGKSSPVCGMVVSKSVDGVERQCMVRGYEVLVDSQSLRDLKEHPNWPRTASLQSTRGIPEKSEPHAGVYFVRRPARTESILSIQWSVFLPIGDDTQVIPCRGDLSYSLVLHGYFFVDSGRRELEGFNHSSDIGDESTEREVRHQWNSLLATQGTLPLVIPSLEYFVGDAGLDDNSVLELTAALNMSALFDEHGTQICREQQWLFRLDGSEGHWVSIASDSTVYAIPAPPRSDAEISIRALSNLTRICSENVVTYARRPALRPTVQFDAWPDLLVAQMLENPLCTQSQDNHGLRYLADFLKSLDDGSLGPRTQRQLKVLFRDYFSKTESHDLATDANRELIQDLLKFIPRQKRMALKLPSSSSAISLFTEISRLEVDVLFVPRELDPNEESAGTLDFDTGTKVMRWLARYRATESQQKETDSLRSRVAVQILGSADDVNELLQACSNLPLFLAGDSTGQQEGLFSFQVLEQAVERHALFLNPCEQLAESLHEALAEEVFYFITRELAQTLFPDLDVARCEVEQCFELLSERPRLETPTSRTRLVKELAYECGAGSSRGARRCIRYLLHGNASHFDDDDALLARMTDQVDTYSIIVDRALLHGERSWRLVPTELASELSPENRRMLNIDVVGHAGAVELIREVGAASFAGDMFTEEQRTQLLVDITDPSLLSQLPIHELTNGGFRSITERCYWKSEYPVASGLEDEVEILRKSADPRAQVQQERLARDFSPEIALEIILEQTDPGQHWQALLNALAGVNEDELEEYLIEKISKEPWLPTAEERFTSPDQVIHVYLLEDEIARVLAGSDSSFVGDRGLRKEAVKHAAFEKLVKLECIPDKKAALDMLGFVVEENEEFAIGRWPVSSSDFTIENWVERVVECFRDADSEVMPVIHLLLRLDKFVARTDWLEHFIPYVCKRVPRERIVHILNFLIDRHVNSPPELQTRTLSLFNFYLQEAIDSEWGDEIIPQIRLLSRLGRWKSPKELCHVETATGVTADTLGIDWDDLLDVEQATIICPGISHDGDGARTSFDGSTQELAPPTEAASSAAVLEEYFQDWEGYVPREIIGGVLSILGDEPGVREVAERYLGNRTLEVTREALSFTIPHVGDSIAPGGDVHDIMRKQRMVIAPIAKGAATISAQSVVGTDFQARIRERIDHLFLGYAPKPFPLQYTDGYRVNWMRIRHIDPEQFTTERLIELLRRSTAQLLSEVYLQNDTKIDDLWEDLAQSEQLDIRIAQRLLLEAAPFYLRQLGLGNAENVGDALRSWDNARRAKVEASQNTAKGSSASKKANKSFANSLSEFKRLLGQDDATKRAVIGAIHEKVATHYQYKPQSIAFELFQNADDAYRELDLLQTDSEASPKQPSFVVSWERRVLRFMHWGRKINEFARGAISRREEGFDRDLEKMLVLSSSDKDAESCEVTGKFGLGFKSVFLVTNTPIIISGRLSFWVSSGVLPIPLNAQQLKERMSYLEHESQDSLSGTLIELPIHRGEPNDVVDDFQRLAHILVVFAMRIKHIHLRQAEDRPCTTSWHERQLHNNPHLYAGTLCPINGQVGRGLVFRGEYGAILFQVGSHGLERLPDDVPSVWVTAPTTESVRVGFALNGHFTLDVGRAQLARNSRFNLERAHQIASDLSVALQRLYSECEEQENWAEVRNQLEISIDCSKYDFWNSFWRLLGDQFLEVVGDEPRDAGRLIREALWSGGHGGMAGLYASCAALPTGLQSEPYRQLVKVEELEFRTSGRLDDDLQLFEAVCELPQFRERVTPGRVASERRILKRLRQLAPELPTTHTQAVTLATVVEWELNANGMLIEPPLAERLGQIVTPELLESLEKGMPSDQDEARAIRAVLDDAMFVACDRHAYDAKKLLLITDSNATEDETLRAKFAPTSCLLSEEYRGSGLSFFLVCRRRLDAPAVALAQWARDAATPDEHFAVLQYFLVGDLGRELAEALRQHELSGTWLAPESLEESESFARLNPEEQQYVLAFLHFHSSREGEGKSASRRPFDSKQILLDIHDWWVKQGAAHHTRRYDERLYPGGRPPVIDGDSSYSDPQVRREWIVLFLAGIMHTMGRTKPEAHRSFLKMCEEQQWLTIFADPASTSEQWLAIIDQFIESQVDDTKFLYWMREYVNIRAISRRLDDYIESFLAINNFRQPFALDEITKTRTSSAFQGGGVDAPPVNRVLGLGACFVVRELVRGNVVTNTHAHRHCFVPVARVRNLMSAIGMPGIDVETGPRPETSRQIYEFLANHLGEELCTFEGGFDLPLLAVAEDRDLQQTFLGRMLESDENNRSMWR